MLQRAALRIREHRTVDLFSQLRSCEDQAAARTSERLVRRGCNDIRMPKRRRMRTAGDQSRDMRHIDNKVSADLLRDLRERRKINRSGVSRSAGQDHLRSARQRFFAHILHIDVASFVHIVEYHIV